MIKDFTLEQIKEWVEQSLDPPLTGDQFLDGRYIEQIDIIGHTNPYYRLFYRLAQELQPALTVELGGWQGTAAAHFAAGYPDGKVITIDHHSDPGDNNHKARMLEVTNRYRNVTYFQAWTWDVVNQVRAFGRIDILFIDSWHEYQYFKRDWDDYSPLLNSPALVICDDIMNTELFIDMVKMWEELPGEKFLDSRPHCGVPMGFLRFGQ